MQSERRDISSADAEQQLATLRAEGDAATVLDGFFERLREAHILDSHEANAAGEGESIADVVASPRNRTLLHIFAQHFRPKTQDGADGAEPATEVANEDPSGLAMAQIEAAASPLPTSSFRQAARLVAFRGAWTQRPGPPRLRCGAALRGNGSKVEVQMPLRDSRGLSGALPSSRRADRSRRRRRGQVDPARQDQGCHAVLLCPRHAARQPRSPVRSRAAEARAVSLRTPLAAQPVQGGELLSSQPRPGSQNRWRQLPRRAQGPQARALAGARAPACTHAARLAALGPKPSSAKGVRGLKVVRARAAAGAGEYSPARLGSRFSLIEPALIRRVERRQKLCGEPPLNLPAAPGLAAWTLPAALLEPSVFHPPSPSLPS